LLAGALFSIALPALASELADAHADYAAAVQEERRLHAVVRERVAELVRVNAETEAALARGARDLNRHQIAMVEMQDRIRQLFVQLDEESRPSDRLARERAQLEEWYDTFLPVVGNLTDRSFALMQAQLQAMADQETIEPGPRRIASFADLRNRLAAVIARSAEENRRIAEQRGKWQAEIDELQRRYLAALLDLRQLPKDPAPLRRLDAIAAVGLAERERVAAETAVERAYAVLLSVLARDGLPALTDVRVSSGNTVFYRAEWRRADSGAADNAEIARLREQARARLRQYDEDIEDIAINRTEQHAVRLELAQQMHAESARLMARADAYAEALMDQAYAALVLDVAQATVEIALTGGAATLARKSAEVATEAAVKAAALKRAARVSVNAMTPMERALLDDVTRRGDALSDGLRRAVKFGSEFLTELLERRLADLRRQGMEANAASVLAHREFQPLLDQLQALQSRSAVANRLASESAHLQQEVAGFFSQLRLKAPADFDEIFDQAFDEIATKAIVLAITQVGGRLTEDGQRASGLKGATGVSDALSGDAMELALGSLVQSYQVQLPAAEALTRWQAIKAGTGRLAGALHPENLKQAAMLNVSSISASVLGSAVKAMMLEVFDRKVDAAVEAFWHSYGVISQRHDVYYASLVADRAAAEDIANLSAERAAHKAFLAGLRAPRSLTRSADDTVRDPEQRLRLELGFSAALPQAPIVSLGGKTLALQPVGALPAQRWAVEFAAAELSDGDLPLLVEPPEGMALDSDPRSVVLPLPQQAGRVTLRGGSDTHHRLKVALQRQTACQTIGFAGHWHTNWGPVSIRQEGNRLLGDFDWLGERGTLESGLPVRNSIDAAWQAGGASGTIKLLVYKQPEGGVGLGAAHGQVPAHLTGGKALAGICVPYPVTAQSLQGEWVYEETWCDGAKHPGPRARLSVQGDELVATAVSSTACLPAGQVLWRGRLRGKIVVGEFWYRSNTAYDGKMGPIPVLNGNVRVEVVDHQTITATISTLRRVAR